MAFNLFGKTSKVAVTAVNLKWKGSTHTLPGVKIKGATFDLTVPFQNKNEEKFEFLKEYFKQTKPSAKIKSIKVSEPFSLVSSSPQTPIEVQDNQKVEFKLRVAAPEYAYEGPLNIELESETEEMVHVEITKIIIKAGDKKAELTDRPTIMNIAKGQIFKQNIHLFGMVGFGASVNKIEVVAPFALVASDPKPPFTIDNQTGYLVDLYIQAPRSNYGGPLEIIIS